MNIQPIPQNVSQNIIKYISLAVFLLIFNPLLLISQTVNVTLSPSKKTIGYGDTLEIKKIIIAEKDTNSFGLSQPHHDSIIIRPIKGYKFIENPSATENYGGDINQIDTIAYDSNKIGIIFRTEGVDLLDNITIENLKLVPISNAQTYGTSLNIKVIKRNPKTSKQIYNKDVGNYRMVKPRIEITNYPKELCENDPFEMDVILRATEGTLKGNEQFIIKYCKAINNDTNTLDVTEALSATDTVKKYKLGALTRYKNAIKVQADFGNGWKLNKVLTIGSGSDSINRKEKPAIPFSNGNTISVSVLENNIKLNDYLSNSHPSKWRVTFEAINGDFITKEEEEEVYRFFPEKAGEGWSKVLVTRNYKTPNVYCEVADTLYINVYPNIITVDDVFCYGQNNHAIIKVAKNALEFAYNELKEYKDPEINFHYLKIMGHGKTLKTFEERKARKNSFLEFTINPSELLDNALKDTAKKDIEIYSIVYADVTYTDSKTESIDIDSSSLPMPDWTCSKGGKKDLRCTKDVEYKAKLQLNMASERSRIVIPRNDGHFLDFKSTYCQNIDSIRLKSNNLVDTITGNSILKYTDDYFIVPGLFAEDQNTPDSIKLFYFDENGCTGDTTYTTTIHAVPQVKFTADVICEDEPQPFMQISPDSEWVNIKGWSWDFGDGFTLSNFSDTSEVAIPDGSHGGNTTGKFRAPSHFYETPGKKVVALEVMSEQGCKNAATETIVIGKYPSPTFTFSGKLQDKTTTLDNLSGLFPDDSVESYTYTITAPSGKESSHELTNRNDFTFEPEEYGVYTAELSARSGNGCTRSVDTLLPVFPIKEVSTDNFYFEDFTGTDLKGWLPSQSHLRGHEASWEHCAVKGSFKTGTQKEGDMWLAGKPADSIDNEISWLESPCFDLSELTFPMVSMDIFESLENGRDGAALFYTLDDGETWYRVGSTQTGANWYNGEGIFNTPGKTMGKNKGSMGWTKDTTAWVTARHPLDTIRRASLKGGAGCIRFRVAYNSNAFHNKKYEGFAVDNFLIGKRKRIILLEEFINSEYEKAHPNEIKTDFEQLNKFVNSYPDEICDIRYHIQTNYWDDPLLGINKQDNNVRAGHYGAFTWGAMWVMDGTIKSRYGDKVLNNNYQSSFEERGLVDPAFEIFNVQTELEGNKLKITATIKKVSAHLDEKYGKHASHVRYAIVQKEYKDGKGKVHRNVMIDLLPTAPGNVVKTLEDFAVGDEVTLTETWIPEINNIQTPGNKFRLIIFIEAHVKTKEIEQVWFTDLDDFIIPKTTRVKDNKYPESFWEIYPNPVSDKINLAYSQSLTGEIQWSVISVNGQKIKHGKSYINGKGISIPVSDLSGGLYLLQITRADGTLINKAFSKVKD